MCDIRQLTADYIHKTISGNKDRNVKTKKTVIKVMLNQESEFFDMKQTDENSNERIYTVYDMIYLSTAIGLSPGGRSTVHIYTQTISRTIQNKQ